MSRNNRKGPIVDPGQCRCCGAVKKCRLLNVEYEWSGQREVYADMFVDCFGLVLSHLEGEELERVICATCVVRLRDACAFKQQVLVCEEKLLSAALHIHDDNEENLSIKQELDEEVTPKESDDDHHATDPIEDTAQMDDDTITATNNEEHFKMTNEVDEEVKQEVDGATSQTPDESDNEEHFKMTYEVDEEVKQEVEGAPSQTPDEPNNDDDDDHHHVTDPIEDTAPMDDDTITATMSVKVKVEELQDSAVEQASPRGPEGATVDAAQTDMLDKLNSMKKKLDQMQHVDDSRRSESPLHRRPVNKELHAIRNAVKIVENSYVCPFVTAYNDYRCIYCLEMFLDPNQLREHTLTHDPKTYKKVLGSKKLIQVDIERIDCRLCDKKIDTIDSFKKHITSVHRQKLYNDVHNEFMPFKLKLGTLSCVECGKSLTVFLALKKHMAEHYGTFICDICGTHYFEEKRLKSHKKYHNKKKDVQMFPCDECDKTFRSKYSRNFHIARIHKNEPAYPCNKCEEIFISYHMRFRHKMNVHGEKRMFPCEGCDKVFHRRQNLWEHNRRTHLQLFRHECSLCDKKFYLPSALRAHMTSHTGERNFRCEFCGKNYPRSKALNAHLQSHSAEKKYKCTLCPSAYTQVTNFKNHMKTKHPDS